MKEKIQYIYYEKNKLISECVANITKLYNLLYSYCLINLQLNF